MRGILIPSSVTVRLIMFQVDGHVLQDLWPANLPRLGNDQRTVEELGKNEKVPEDVEAIQAWAYPRYCPGRADRTRRYILALADPSVERPGVVYQACIRVQGFVGHASLGPLGNWRT